MWLVFFKVRVVIYYFHALTKDKRNFWQCVLRWEMCFPLCVGAPGNERLVGMISATAAQHDTRTKHPQHLKRRDRRLISDILVLNCIFHDPSVTTLQKCTDIAAQNSTALAYIAQSIPKMVVREHLDVKVWRRLFAFSLRLRWEDKCHSCACCAVFDDYMEPEDCLTEHNNQRG